MNGFSAEVRPGEPRIVDLSGQLDGGAGDSLLYAFEAVCSEADAVVFNFSDVDYINSAGIAAIVNLLARAQRDRKRVLAYGVSDHFTEIFTITRVAEMMPLYNSEQEAAASAVVPEGEGGEG